MSHRPHLARSAAQEPVALVRPASGSFFLHALVCTHNIAGSILVKNVYLPTLQKLFTPLWKLWDCPEDSWSKGNPHMED